MLGCLKQPETNKSDQQQITTGQGLNVKLDKLRQIRLMSISVFLLVLKKVSALKDQSEENKCTAPLQDLNSTSGVVRVVGAHQHACFVREVMEAVL